MVNLFIFFFICKYEFGIVVGNVVKVISIISHPLRQNVH